MDSVTLRYSHFNLGDFNTPYTTTSMEQSLPVLNGDARPARLDENVKKDLRSSHFVFGNDEPQYQTMFQRDYYDKSKLNNRDNVDFKGVERGLRATNYVLGDEKPNYLSETAEKYTIPPLNPNALKNQQKISTAELQQSHYVFGTDKVPWVTTQKVAYTPKKVDNKLYTKNLTKTNFTLGDAEPTLKSVNQETFVRHPLSINPLNKELIADLRNHHFAFGNDDYPSELTTVHKQTYRAPKLLTETYGNGNKRIDPQALRQTNWTFGDNALTPSEHFATTYDTAMTPKQRIKNDPIPASTFQSSFKITGNGPSTYATEFKANYVPISNKISPEEFKAMQNVIKNIRGSHFDLGEMHNDYRTTMGNAYQYDPQTAKNAKPTLDKELINDLRATHYKLGYGPSTKITTHRASYVPMKSDVKLARDPHLRDSHFQIGHTDNATLEGKTIYMTDYIPQPLPIIEDDD